MATSSSRQKLREALARVVTLPVDIASLAAFRILFGLLMAAAMVRFLAKGWVAQLYVEPAFHFTYPGFEWIRPWPTALMHAHFVLLTLLALGVAFGFFYRICITLFFLGFAYVELMDQTTYLNHYYLISLLSGLLIFLPAHRAWSFDTWRRPEIAIEAVPAWALNILRFQVAVVYVFAGLAKLNADWLFRAEPLRIWLAARSDLPLFGPLLGQLWVAYAASWFGAVFDLSVVFFLLCGRTRRIAYALAVFFHVMTWLLFNIGMFPWVMLVAATVFFPAHWPRDFLLRVSARAGNRFKVGTSYTSPKCPEETPGKNGDSCNSSLRCVQIAGQIPVAAAPESPLRVLPRYKISLLLPAVCVYAAVQLALPLRSFFCAAPPAWTGAGFNCAWRVMVAEKTGYVEFYAFDPVIGRRWRLPARDYLTPRQETMMAQDPDLIRAFARHLAADLRKQGHPQIQIRADAFATLNGRPSQRMIDPKVNLAARVPGGWILPLAD